MISLLKYRLLKLKDNMVKDDIPWNMIDQYPGMKELAIEIIMAKSYDIIIAAINYDSLDNTHPICDKLKNILEEQNINISILSERELEHLVLLSSFSAARAVTKYKPKNIELYMINKIPFYFMRELLSEIGDDRFIEYREPKYEKRTEDNSINLPSSPAEYINKIKNMGVSNYTNNYSFYNRTHLYRILNRNQ